ncbi:MAG: nqo3 [Rickettsiales bacterium]|jgi:NADH-quinone oxidoreductase subunit G|nr:nqo3 [Rickettsiales bacterium]
MPKLKVNGREVEVPQGATVLQACEVAGEEIPRFCYHERLKIAGNCRMCLVQIEGGPPKPAASCAMPAGEGMVVHTNTPMVKKAREGVMEFLLINHPLDCPICDQGGECDLQDQAMTYGCGSSRYDEHKRAVKDKYMGPLVKTHMTRCIHCTRCIRFISDVAGVPELGLLGRGEHVEVGTYVEKALTSELSGNIIDLCPVGALTSRPYAFKARSWELRKVESIDVMDAVGSNIRVDYRGNEVMRVLPRLHEDINEEWISDITRFAYDGLKTQRLDRPYVRRDGKLQEATWEEALSAVAEKLETTKPNHIAALAGDLADVEAMFALKELLAKLGVTDIDCRQDGAKLDVKSRASYLFNTTIAGIEQADVCLLIGTNPRLEAPLINARLRKQYLKGNFRIGLIGEEVDLTYKYKHFGNDPKALEEILKGTHPAAKVFAEAKNPMLILGQGALTREDGAEILGLARQIAEKYNLIRDDWNGFNVLHRAAARVGGLDVGFVPNVGGRDTDVILSAAEKGDVKVVYLLGADEIDTKRLGNAFVIYQGHHGDAGAHRADVILPGAAYTEKDATFVNTEGRVQRTRLAVFPPGQAKEDWKILRALSETLGKPLEYNDIEALRKKIGVTLPHLLKLDVIEKAPWAAFGKEGKITSEAFVSQVKNIYMTNAIARASATMAKCTSELLEGKGACGCSGEDKAA